MPFGQSTHERVESNNNIEIPDGTREFEIADAWFYNIKEVPAVSKRTGEKYTKREYTPDQTNDQDVQIKLRLVKRPDIVISDTLRAYVGKKSKFAQLMYGLTGVEPGNTLVTFLTDGQEFDAKKVSAKIRKEIVGKRVLCTTIFNADSGYVRVKAYTQTPHDSEDDLASVPLQRNPQFQSQQQTDEQRASEAYEDDDPLSFDGVEALAQA